MRYALLRSVAVVALAAVGCSYDRPADVLGDGEAPKDAPADTVDGPSASALGEACNPLDQESCGGVNGKCGWFNDQESPQTGHSGCAPSGPAQLGQACTFGATGPNGYSNCVEGSECFSGQCQALCGQPFGTDPQCDAQHACVTYSGIFETQGNATAGACTPQCDPLTQAVGTSSASAACGSVNPGAPNLGCYSIGSVSLTQFICAPVPSQAQNLTDRMPAFGSGGNVFLNGCAAGYLPFFRESSGSTTVVCAGICAPAKTDTTLAGNVRGNSAVPVKLHTQPAAVAGNGVCVTGRKGSLAATQNQNCIHSWFYATDMNGEPVTSQYNDTVGVCFAPQFYTYDHDANGGTPERPIPSCNTLAPKLAPPANCTCVGGVCTGTGCPDGLAHQWGCYPKADSQLTAIPAVAREFRVGSGARAMLRPHVIR